MQKQKSFKNFVSEGFDFGVKDEKDLQGFDAAIGNDEALTLYKYLKKEYPKVEYPLALNRGTGGVKVRVKSFDLDQYKADNFDKRPSAKKLDLGQGSINSSGGELKGDEWEVVICVCYNMRSKRVSLEEAKKLAGVDKSYKSKYDGALEVGFQLVDNAFRNPTGVMEHFGSGSTKLTSAWDDYFIKHTGKSAQATTRTPKTDMYIGNERISLKKAGGSQLMSGGPAESLATLAFVYEALPQSMKTAEFQKTWNSLEKDIETKFTKVKLDKGKSTTDIKRDIKSGIKNEATQAIGEALVGHQGMQTAIRSIFESKEATKLLVKESMTGQNKFADKRAIASHIMVFDPDTGKASYKEIDDKLLSVYANNVSFQINFKKAGSSSTPYSNMRVGVGKGADMLGEYVKEALEDELLDRDVLHEGLVGKIGQGIKKVFKSIVKSVWAKIKKAISKNFTLLFRLTGLKVRMKKDPTINWKI